MTNLPAGWTRATVGELCAINPRHFDEPAADKDMVSKIPMAAVQAETGRVDSSEIVRYGDVKGKSLTSFQENDVLFAKVTPCMENGKVALAAGLRNGRAVGSTELFALRSFGAVEPKYLMYFLLQRSIRKDAERAMTGAVGLRRVSQQYLASLEVPIPPLAEQQRILGVLEDHLSVLASGLSSSDRASKLLEVWRSSILARAMRGTLLEDDLSEGTASDLDTRKLNNPAPGPWPLPSTWVWRRIGDLFKVSVGATPSRSKAEFWKGDIPWVSSGEVAFGRIGDTREKVSVEALSNPATRLHPPGTVLIAMIGEGKTRGQVAILDIAAAHNQNCASIRVSETAILPEYVYWLLYSRYSENRSVAAGGNQPALNKAKVESMMIPLAPVGTQRKLVAMLSEVDYQISRTRDSLDTIKKRAEFLKTKVFEEAFSGRLTPQDPSDEPASVLLERIQAEQSTKRPGSKRTAVHGEVAL